MKVLYAVKNLQTVEHVYLELPAKKVLKLT